MIPEFLQTLSNSGQMSPAMEAGYFSVLLASLAAYLLIILIFGIIIYIYSSLAWMTIARKLKYDKPWLAWIPFANIAMILQLGDFSWGWVFLFLIPILGWIALSILLIIATWRIFKKRNYSGWLILPMFIPDIGVIIFLIIIGFVAWKDRGEDNSYENQSPPYENQSPPYDNRYS